MKQTSKMLRGLLTGLFAAASVAACADSENPPAYCGPADYAHAPMARRLQGFGSIAVASNGRAWACWQADPYDGDFKQNYVVLATRAPGGDWKEVFVVDPDNDYGHNTRMAFSGQVWVDPDGKLRWFWGDRNIHDPQTAAELAAADFGVWMTVIDDATAEPPTTLPTPVCVAQGSMTGKPIVLSDGAWALPVNHWLAAPSCCVYVSTDHGATWTQRGSMSVPEEDIGYHEASIVETANGVLRAYVRTKTGMRVAESSDLGATWSAMTVPPGFATTPSRPCVVRLASGNCLMLKHGPLDQDVGRTRITAYLSQDNGATWGGGLCLDSLRGLTAADCAQDANGKIHAIFEYDSVGRKEIVTRAFTEADVLGADPYIEEGVVTSHRPYVRDEPEQPLAAVLACSGATTYGIETDVRLPTIYAVPYTIEAWIQPTAYSGYSYIVSQYHSGDGGWPGRMAMFLNANGQLTYFVGGGWGSEEAAATSTGTVPLNAWTHVAVTYVYRCIRLYINGVLDSVHEVPALHGLVAEPFTIGAVTSAWGQDPFVSYPTFSGRIGCVRAWSRQLQEADLQENMHRLCSASRFELDLLGEWVVSPACPNAVVNRVNGRLSVMTGAFTPVSDTSFTLRPPSLEEGDFLKFNRYSGANEILMTDVSVSGEASFTLEAWIRPDPNWDYNLEDQEMYILSTYELPAGGVPATGRSVLELYNGKLRYWAHTPNDWQGVESGVAIPPGVWTHVAMSRDNSNVKLYVNGACVKEQNLTLYSVPNTKIGIGSLDDAACISFWGGIREVRAWRGRRTDAEIAANYVRTMTGQETNLLGCWPLNEGAGDTVSNRVTGVLSTIVHPWSAVWSLAAPVVKLAGEEADVKTGSWVANFLSGYFTGTGFAGEGYPATYINTGTRLEGGDFTIEAWVNPQGNAFRNPVVTQMLAEEDRMQLSINNGELQFLIVDTGMDWVSGPTIPLNTWTHVAVTRAGDTITLLVNGAVVTTQPGYTTKALCAANLAIGHMPFYGYMDAFAGSIAEVRAWRRARSAEEITRDYRHELRTTSPQLVGYWRLNEATGTTFVNAKTQAADATGCVIWQRSDLVIGEPLPPPGTVVIVR